MAKPNDERLTANTLLVSAIDFADLADYAASRSGSSLNLLLLTFLLGRAYELALKAVLRQDGASDGQLRRYGHNLRCLHNAVLEAHTSKRLRLTSSREEVLRGLGIYYTGKYLEYPQVGTYRLPPPYTLRGLVREAIALALDHIRGPGTYRRFVASSKPGVVIAPAARYGNASRRRTYRAQIRQFERLMRSA